ncbi:DUF1822 family protein [Oculatella sp. LEGE 06141]|nr:DUF1822 family protein [Oculatella sp. LEGE 06141]
MFLNKLCLETVSSWLKEDDPSGVEPWPNTATLPSFWEVVNGTALALSGIKLVLIPSESIDMDEIRVPQEWVDIPSWSADYYIPVRVNPNEGWIKIHGFARHRDLKSMGIYDPSDRCYSLASEKLINDVCLLWVAQELSLNERVAVDPLAPLSLTQAQSLLQRLGNPSIVDPQFEVPFSMWASLIAHDGWRQQLSDQRRGIPNQQSVQQWLESGISEIGRQLGWSRVEFQTTSSALARSETAEDPTGAIAFKRDLSISGVDCKLWIHQIESTVAENVWRFELRSPSSSNLAPGICLRLLTEDLQPFENNEVTSEGNQSELYIEVALEPGEGLVWEIDPSPEHYVQEILRF